jgi:hypothetical protein
MADIKVNLPYFRFLDWRNRISVEIEHLCGAGPYFTDLAGPKSPNSKPGLKPKTSW